MNTIGAKGTSAKTDELTWQQLLIFAGGCLAGTLLGIWAMTGLAAAMAARAPGFWFVSRAAGIAGYLVLWAATLWGISLSSKGIGGLVSGPLAYALHNVVSWLALGFATIHALSLLGDRIVSFNLAGVLIPFTATYEPLLTGLGTLSLYVGILVTASFYWRQRLGLRLWRSVHALSYLMFVAVTAHGLLLGTDSGTLLMKAVYVLAGTSVLYLTVFRLLTAGNSRVAATQSRPAA